MLKIVFRSAVFAAFVWGLVSPSYAQERPNPFIPPSSAAEEQAKVDERLRGIVWELHPEMKNMIMKDVTAAQTSLEIKMRRHVDAVISSEMGKLKTDIVVAAPSGAQGNVEGVAGSGPSDIPEGSNFVSCVNGKALYSDKNNNLFQVPENSGQANLLCSD